MDANVVLSRLRAADLPLGPGLPLVNAVNAERYAHIVWRDYRCGLVHESRVVDSGFNPHPYVNRPPFYFTHIESGHEVHRLVIPTRFMLRTLCCALDRYRAHCTRHDLDPYDALGIP